MKSFLRTGRWGSLLLLALLLVGCACFQKGPSRSDPAYLLNYAVKIEVTFDLAPDTAISGSGSVFYSSAARSLVLTAAHVCDGDHPLKPTITAQRVEGHGLPARVVWEDKVQDLCVLMVTGYAGPATTVAKSLPPLGVLVYFPGAPLGLFGHGVGFLEQGHYAGRSPVKILGARRLLIGGTSTSGASGSGIYYQGQLVGVLLAVGSSSGYIVIGADMDAVRSAVKAGFAELTAATQSPCAEKR